MTTCFQRVKWMVRRTICGALRPRHAAAVRAAPSFAAMRIVWSRDNGMDHWRGSTRERVRAARPPARIETRHAA